MTTKHNPHRRRAFRAALFLTLIAGAGTASAARPTAGSVTSERLKTPSGPNSVRGLAGEPTVDPFSATVGHQVDFELPAGLGGLAPSLSMSYSGALGNGPMGIGWTLTQARIQRSTRLGVPTFTAADELEIVGVGGGRLVPIDAAATEYRVEGLGQTVRVTRAGAGFIVDDGSGVRYKLGLTAAARQEDPTHTRTAAWLCEEITNQHGEIIKLTYAHDQGQVYLSGLVWGPGDVYRADLAYESRADANRSFRSGFSVVTAKRLATVTVQAFGVVRRAYQLEYDTSFPVARLAGVTSTGKAGAGAWPALRFTYAESAAPLVMPVAGVDGWHLNEDGATLVDLDGDGAAEMLQLSSAGHSYRTNRDGVFSTPEPLSGSAQSITAVQLQDVDGDARPELLRVDGDGWQVLRFARTEWVDGGTWPGTTGVPLKQPDVARFADLNGDGLVDVVQWDGDGLHVRRGTRTGLAAPEATPKIGGAVTPTPDGRFHDVNGDGLDDYVVVHGSGLDEYLGRGDGTFEPAVTVSYPAAGTWIADDTELGDLDRDGLVDLVRIDEGNVSWFRGNADGTFATDPVVIANPETHTSSVVVALTDINGNGSQDVVWSSVNGTWRMDLAGATSAGMLTRIQNGLGMDVTIEYRSSHTMSAAARLAGMPWISEVPISMPVPVRKVTYLGAGETDRRIDYSVRDGFWDAEEQRFGGFLVTQVTTAGATPADSATVITRHHAGTGVDRNLRGKPYTVQVFDGTGHRLSLTEHSWETRAVAGLPDVPMLRAPALLERKVRFEDTTPVRETRTTYEYDAQVREQKRTEYGRTDLAGAQADEAVYLTTYADDATTWIRNQVCEEKVTDLAGAIVSHAQHFFGDDTATEPLCEVGKGWPKRSQSWLAEEDRWVVSTSTEYEPNGNVASVVSAGVTTEIDYDATGLFAIAERRVAPGEPTFTWTAAWDQVLGVSTSVTDPNGHVTHVRYDELGRVAGTSIDDRPEHRIFEYDWRSPMPRVTAWEFDGAEADLAARPWIWTPASKWRVTDEVSNGLGEVRYRAQRLDADRWIISGYQERDAASRVVFAGRPVYAGTMWHLARPANIVGDQLTYDPLGRLIRQQTPTGAVRRIAYTAFERVTHESDLAPVRSVLDGMGRAILTERSLADGTHELVQATYDAAGRLTTMKLAGGAVERVFTYDTLGRLTSTYDPDLGSRTLEWDDGGRLRSETNAMGQPVSYVYDGHGRLATRTAGGTYTYHYDTARPGAGPQATNLAGRLAWIDEPTGGVDVGYSARGLQHFSRRRIDGVQSESTLEHTPSGLVRSIAYDDGFAMSYAYDAAGRLVQIGDLWSMLRQDASGAPVRERAGNGVETEYTRDLVGLATRVRVTDPTGLAIYDVEADRNDWSAITEIVDLDKRGLDHSTVFAYDAFARLTGATIGGKTSSYAFTYGYDVLHNMRTRTATGPTPLSGFFGTYRYGEDAHALRQLTSITDGAGVVQHTFAYDAAGRQTTQDDLTMTYDPSDRLVRVDGLPGGAVQHAYGHDGQRLKTVAPDGAVSYFFGDGTSQRNGVREHDVSVGERVVARVESPAATSFAARWDQRRSSASETP